jgi:hypothetical protein
MNPTTSGAVKDSISNEDYKKRMEILEKPWADCSVDEKLEKIKNELIELSHMSWSINNLQNEIAKLKEHDHKDGRIIIPINRSALNGLGSIGSVSRRNNLS